MFPRLVLNSQFSYLILPIAGITDMYYNAELKNVLLT
jgi:hypothetical protein